MLPMLLLLFCLNTLAMSPESRQEAIAQKQFLLYRQEMLITSEHSTAIAKSLAKTYNIMIFLRQDELQGQLAIELLKLVNEKDPTLGGTIYDPQSRIAYTCKHRGFYNNLVTTQQLKDRYPKDTAQQYTQIQIAIQLIPNNTIRDWLSAFLTFSIMEKDSFEYQESKRTLGRLHRACPAIIPQP